MKMNNFILTLALLLGFLSSCTLVDHDDAENSDQNFGYETAAISNILHGTCAASGCHGGNSPVNGLGTDIHSELFTGTKNRPFGSSATYSGEVVIPYNIDKSLLTQFVKGNIESPTSFNHKILTSSQIKTLENWIEAGAKNYNGDVPFENPESYRVYICNSESANLSIIDGSQNVVSRLSNLSNNSTPDETPYWVAEYGSYYYVTISSSNKILKFRKSDNTLVGSLSNITNAGIIKINYNGTKAYVSSNLNSGSTNNLIYIINTETMSIRKTISFSRNGLLHGLALDKNRKYLYVADALNNVIYIINTQNDTVVNARFSLTTNYYPSFIEVSQDGNYLYASAKNTNELLVLNAGTQALFDKISLLPNPMGIAISSNGSKIYVASSGGNSVEVVTKTNNFWSKTNTITHPTMSMPYGIDITSDDSYLYLTNQNSNNAFIPTYKVTGEGNISTVTIINATTESVVKAIEVEEIAMGISVEKL